MAERHFHEELEEVNDLLLAMSSLVVEIFDDTLESFLENDAARAKKLLDDRGRVDSLEIAVEERCLSMIARHQPVAIDLRNIITAINIIRDLERIDDIAMDMCEEILDLGDLPRPDGMFHIPALAEAVKEMLHDSVRAFVARDPDWARAICERDDVIDDLEKRSEEDIIEFTRENPDTFETMLRYLSVTHSLERIGDHCTNIGEMVVYLTQAKIIKHHYDEQGGEEENE
ncbi:MAG: phosphate signaling complex protein PhoU [Candidatus Coatesbacteria bacterium]|nr:MAG: phosphate signaling complex protein PhoU [Candidatus Coatesbacteria bacterium]